MATAKVISRSGEDCPVGVLTPVDEQQVARRAVALHHEMLVREAAAAASARSVGEARDALRVAQKRAMPVAGEVGAAQAALRRAERDEELRSAELDRIVEDYHAIRAHFVNHNIRFVRKVVSSKALWLDGRIDREELVHEGMKAMLEAFARFDPERGNRFVSFVEAAVVASVGQYRECACAPVRIGKKKRRQVRQAAADRQASRAGSPGTPETGSVVYRERPGARGHDWAESLLNLLSLDRPLIDSGTTYGDLVADDDVEAPERAAIARLETDTLRAAVHRLLEPRHRIVIQYRFGLFGCPRETLEEIGERLGVSRQRTHQMLKEALARLGADPEIRALNPDLPGDGEAMGKRAA